MWNICSTISEPYSFGKAILSALTIPNNGGVDPLQASQTPVDEMMRHAYVDPNDPTRIFLQQPSQESELRRRTYMPHSSEQSI